jgi:hypothetical protein
MREEPWLVPFPTSILRAVTRPLLSASSVYYGRFSPCFFRGRLHALFFPPRPCTTDDSLPPPPPFFEGGNTPSFVFLVRVLRSVLRTIPLLFRLVRVLRTILFSVFCFFLRAVTRPLPSFFSRDPPRLHGEDPVGCWIFLY